MRTVIIYVLLSAALRLMGKRQLGELDVGELVSTLLISELAAIPIDDPDIPLLNAVIPIILILSAEIIISTLKNKSEKLKETFEGKPVYIIYKGRIIQRALCENRISINELLSEIRSQGVGDIGEVSYAILEQNGVLSIIKKSDAALAHTLIIDGNIIEEEADNGYDKKKIAAILENRKIKQSEVFLMTATDDGNLNIILKDGSF